MGCAGPKASSCWPQATKYKDFRQLLDKEKSIDAVTVVIPDHMHANVALAAMQRGKHVYVEKPLTRTPWEARAADRRRGQVQGCDPDGQSGLLA